MVAIKHLTYILCRALVVVASLVCDKSSSKNSRSVEEGTVSTTPSRRNTDMSILVPRQQPAHFCEKLSRMSQRDLKSRRKASSSQEGYGKQFRGKLSN